MSLVSVKPKWMAAGTISVPPTRHCRLAEDTTGFGGWIDLRSQSHPIVAGGLPGTFDPAPAFTLSKYR